MGILSQGLFGKFHQGIGTKNQGEQAAPLDATQAAEKSPVRLEKIDVKSKGQITDHEPTKFQSGSGQRRALDPQHPSHRDQKEHLVNLGWMPGNAAAVIDAPRQLGPHAAGVVGQTGEKAPDSADAHAEDQRVNADITRGTADAHDFFGQGGSHPASQKPADDGFASEPEVRIVAQSPVKAGGLHPGQKLGPYQGSENAPNKNPGVLFMGESRS